MKEFLIDPPKPTRNMYSNNVVHQQPQQQRQPPQLQPNMMYGSSSAMCGVPNSSNYSNSNCYESNGALDSLSMHSASSVGTPLVSPHYLPNLASHLPGMSSSSLNLSGSSSRMGLPSNNIGLSTNTLVMPVQPQAALGMSLSGNGPGANRIPYNSSANQYAASSSSVMGIHPSGSMHGSSSSSIPMHNPSPNSLGMHSNSPTSMGLHQAASTNSMGIHPAPSPGGMGMHSSASSAMGIHSTSGMHSTPSPVMHPGTSPSNRGIHSSASPGGMGMHSSASPSGMGMHSSASPSGMGIRSNPSPAMHSSASPGGMGMHSSASPAGMGMHSNMPSPAPSMGKPSASPSRPSMPIASPNVLNMQSSTAARSPMAASASRSPYQSSPSHFSNTSPANIPSASPSGLSRTSASPGRVNMITTSPLSSQDVNGASYSASCSEGGSPAGLERLSSGVTVSMTERGGEILNQVRRTPPLQDVLTITPVQDPYELPGISGKKDLAQVKKVRRKNTEESGAKSKKRKAVRAQLVNSDPRGEPGFGAPSLYDLLTQENPCGEGSLLSVGEIPSGTAHYDITTGQGTVKRGRKRKTEGAPKAPARQRTTVTYQSQISSQNGIKLKIKKSEPVKKPVKQRVRKKKGKSADSDSDDGHHRRVNHKSVVESCDDGKEQSAWGTDNLPKNILHKIFKYVSHDEGCVPFLVRYDCGVLFFVMSFCLSSYDLHLV